MKQRVEHGQQEPFFLTVHVIDPHHPYRLRTPIPEGFAPPTDFATEREEEGGREAIVLRRPENNARQYPEQVMGLYDAEIRHIDAIMASLVESLEDDNTAIVLLSDHGEGFGEHDYFIHGNTLYQELLHVPLWLRVPGRAPTVITEPVSLLDVYPTLLTLARIPLPPDLDGQPLPLAVRENPPERLMIAEGMYSGEMEIAARQGPWKYVRTHPDPITQTRPRDIEPAHEELYDLSISPIEGEDLSTNHPERVRAMRAATLNHQQQTLRGVHLRCTAPTDLEVTVDATIGHIEVIDGGAGRVTLRRDRAGVEMRLKGESHLVLRTVGNAERIQIVDGEGQAVFDGLAPAPVAPSSVGACTLWVVGGQDQAGELSEQDAEELRALGYLE